MDMKAVEEKRKDKLPYEQYKKVFEKCDFEKMAKNTGGIYLKDKNEIHLELMGKGIIVKCPSGEIVNEDYSKIDKYKMKTLILRFLINSKSFIEPTDKIIAYRDVPGGNVYNNNFYGRCILRLAKTFGEKITELEEVLKELKATPVEMGDLGYKFKFINNIYLTIALWHGDEEFPPSSQILFDKNVLCYFSAEDLAVVGDVFIGELTQRVYSI